MLIYKRNGKKKKRFLSKRMHLLLKNLKINNSHLKQINLLKVRMLK
jgi:hypothetical protein